MTIELSIVRINTKWIFLTRSCTFFSNCWLFNKILQKQTHIFFGTLSLNFNDKEFKSYRKNNANSNISNHQRFLSVLLTEFQTFTHPRAKPHSEATCPFFFFFNQSFKMDSSLMTAWFRACVCVCV